MRNVIYKAIAGRVKAAKLAIHHIDLWNQNVDKLSENRAFRFPALFVEFEPIQWAQRGQGVRAADIRVRIHIVTKAPATPEVGGKYQDRALEHLDFLESVGGAMQGLSGEGFNGFALVETVTDHNHDGITHDELCFATHVTDTSGVKPQATISGVSLAGGRGE